MTTATTTRRTIAERLKQIARHHQGRLEPDDVVADARDESSPLHSHFEWDDGIAADEYRREQARVLIRSVRLEVTEVSPEELNRTPAWVRDSRRASHQQGYVETTSIRLSSAHARETVKQEIGRVIALWRRVLAVSDVLGLRDQALEELRRAEAWLERVSVPTPAPRRRAERRAGT